LHGLDPARLSSASIFASDVIIALPSVARARERLAAAGVRHAEVLGADVATYPFVAGSFDLAFSRLGVMFFADPTAAFVNVHRAMKPTGRLALAVFRPASENAWPSAPAAAVRHLLQQFPLIALQPLPLMSMA
jgi:SAM-dependent methyltransferase